MEELKTILTHLAELKELFQKNTTTTSQSNKDDMLNLSQASAYSGYSKSFLYKKSSSNDITVYKPHGKIFFKRCDIDDFMSQGKVQSNKEIKQEAQQSLIKTSF